MRSLRLVPGPAPVPTALLAILALQASGCPPRATSGERPRAPATAAGPAASAALAAPSAEPPRSPEEETTYPDGDDSVLDDVATGTGSLAAEPDARPPHPLDGWSDERIAEAVRNDLAGLGSISLGSPNAGRLLGGVQMPEGPGWVLVDPAHAHGTEETVAALVTCIDLVRAKFPDTPPLRIGHLSAPRGGPLSPHLSHQSGRDVDVGYYYRGDQRWFARATASNLDRARTWALVRALIAETDVEMILIDAGLQRLLREHALDRGEDPTWLRSVFQGGDGLPPLIRHARGHATHLHIRFHSPIARETARRAQPALVAAGLIEPPVSFALHRAKDGDTLGKLARRYGTSVASIQRANGLRSTVILARKTYRIPQPNAPAPPSRPVVAPPRRVPPTPSAGDG